MADYIYYGKELYHHGTKGQKWGVRNYQNEDGSYTPKGQAENSGHGRYSQSKGNTSKNEENEINFKPLIGAAIGAAALVGAGTIAYFAISDAAKSGMDYSGSKDFILSSNDLLQRISPVSETELSDVFYASFGEHDNKRYEGLIPDHYRDRYGVTEVNIKKLALSGDIKIAGHDTASKIFYDLKKDNLSIKSFCIKNRINSYDEFNRYICARSREDIMPGIKNIYNSYFDKLKDLGYGGLIDINDQDYSGYSAKCPLVLFNNSNYSVESSKSLKYDEYIKSGKRNVEQALMAAEGNSIFGLKNNSGKKYTENGAAKVANVLNDIGFMTYTEILGLTGLIIGEKIGEKASNKKEQKEKNKNS